MALPITFANLPTGSNPASTLDQNFAAVASMGATYCSASGTNNILLTVQPNQPNPTGYAAGARFTFTASATNTGPVTVQVAGLAPTPLLSSGNLLAGGEMKAGMAVEIFYDGLQFQIIAGAGAVGTTLTTPLTISAATGVYPQLILNTPTATNPIGIEGQVAGAPVWAVVLDSGDPMTGGDSGANFSIDRFSDAGARIDSPVQINRATGQVLIETLTPVAGVPHLVLDTPASGYGITIGGSINRLMRWTMGLASLDSESTENLGSNFTINRFSDAGAYIDSPLYINRQTGIVTLSEIAQSVTPLPHDNSNNLATTAFVTAAVAAGPGGGPGTVSGDQTIYAKTLGAVFNGSSHPLSNYYSTLAAAQAVYPHATSLTNEIDWAATQGAINQASALVAGGAVGGMRVVVPTGIGMFNMPLTRNKSNVPLISMADPLDMQSHLLTTGAPAAQTIFRWNGPARTVGQSQIYMLTTAPLLADQNRIFGAQLRGILFDCQGIAGVSGVLFLSMIQSSISVSVAEPRPIVYTTTAAAAAGTYVLTFASTTGMAVGQPLCGAGIVPGSYIMALTGTTVTMQQTTTAGVANGAQVAVGGEALRVDVMGGLADVNDSQLNEFWIDTSNMNGAAGLTCAQQWFCATANVGSYTGGTHFGNTSVNTIRYSSSWMKNGDGVQMGDSDHNHFGFLTGGNYGASTNVLWRCSAWNSNPSNQQAGARYNTVQYMAAGQMSPAYFQGTDTGGNANASIFNVISSAVSSVGGFQTPGYGTNAIASFQTDIYTTLMVPYNTNQGISAQYGDGTALGGASRGSFSVDLQTNRNAAAAVASGQASVIAGGNSNYATSPFSAVGGGTGNAAQANSACVPGGANNSANGVSSIAMGQGAKADLYSVMAFSGSQIASGRWAQMQTQVLQATSGPNVTPVRLTADGLAAGSQNVMNVTYANAIYALRVQLVATDTTTGANAYCWQQPIGLLKRNGGVGAMTYVPGTPTSVSTGTTTGIAITESADTTNGGYSLVFTPPTGNTSAWRVVATVSATRVDGV